MHPRYAELQVTTQLQLPARRLASGGAGGDGGGAGAVRDRHYRPEYAGGRSPRARRRQAGWDKAGGGRPARPGGRRFPSPRPSPHGTARLATTPSLPAGGGETSVNAETSPLPLREREGPAQREGEGVSGTDSDIAVSPSPARVRSHPLPSRERVSGAGLRVLCFPTDRAAYGRLSRLLSVGRQRAPKGECRLWLADLLAHGEGQIVVALPPEQPDEEFSTALLTLTITSRIASILLLANSIEAMTNAGSRRWRSSPPTPASRWSRPMISMCIAPRAGRCRTC